MEEVRMEVFFLYIVVILLSTTLIWLVLVRHVSELTEDIFNQKISVSAVFIWEEAGKVDGTM